ncbi:GNAT family N-acetyltransferase [Craterilacuibacter sinensis]|uniref:GNAT family N-acetyltransferase n=1 Tax=Craterilacuibacter sinensis TaxID=2686017 RepID=A0A845BID6_9NEIS|nr:GNAT family N-acetyltransferase [Craterilacuibacter sinensis]MXR35959.1 GNAT family N-acetyltransferase [Craterilacuibacter sinensis]
MATSLTWHCHGFDGFSIHTLYAALALRDRVFVVEQDSIYGDIDGVDPDCLHLCAYDGQGRLAAYARLIAPGDKYEGASAIGRVVLEPALRGTGLGKALLAEAVRQCESHWPDSPVMLSAQADKLGFYQTFGFKAVSEPYDDGGILHVTMRRD